MRALNISPVILTGCCLLWPTLVASDSTPNEGNFPLQGPSSIEVLPFPITPNQPFTVQWQWVGPVNAIVQTVNFIEVDSTGIRTLAPASVVTSPCTTQNNQKCSANFGASSSATGTAPATLDALKTYKANIIWSSFMDTDLQPNMTTGPSTQLAVYTAGLQTSRVSESSSTTPSSVTSNLQSSVITSGSSSEKAVPIPTSTTSASLASNVAGVGTVPSSDSSGLSTGAKVGIAIGAVGFVLIILIAALLIWRRNRQKQLRALPSGMPYSHDIGSTNRDFTAEKEMHVINSPVDTLQNGYSGASPVTETQIRSQMGSYPLHDDHAAVAGIAGINAAYAHPHQGLNGPDYDDSSSPVGESQVHIPPPAAAAAAAGAAIQRKPVGATSGPTHHLREPGMSDEEMERLEEEERRLDEAIAEAERRRQS